MRFISFSFVSLLAHILPRLHPDYLLQMPGFHENQEQNIDGEIFSVVNPEEGEPGERVQLDEVGEEPGGDPAVDARLETGQVVGVASQNQELDGTVIESSCPSPE